MSAWTVSKEHIDVLVTALHPASQEEGNEWGKTLWLENSKSIVARYGNADEGSVDNALRYVWVSRVVPDSWIARAAACFDYQACEHGPKYDASWSAGAMQGLRGAFHRYENLTRDYNSPCSATNVPWGIGAKELGELAASGWVA